MKPRKRNYILLVTLLTVVVVNVKVVMNTNRSCDLSMTSIETLSDNINGEGGDTDNNQESNNQGSGKFYYKHLLGKPATCTLYCNVSVNGTITYTETSLGGNAGWTSTKTSGIRDSCPKSGSGCTAYSCTKTN